MPKLNPSRPIVEQYYRVPVRELFWNSTGTPGKPTEHVVGPVCLRVWTNSGNNGVIEIGSRRWLVQYHPRSRWRNDYDEYCADYWVIGTTGKRHRYLLIAPDGSECGTVSELGAHYQSSHIYSPNRIKSKRQAIFDELGLRNGPGDFAIRYIPLSDTDKPKGMWRKTWERQQKAMMVGGGSVLVKKPPEMRLSRFHKLLRYLNDRTKGSRLR
jgi:hypothetical protein